MRVRGAMKEKKVENFLQKVGEKRRKVHHFCVKVHLFSHSQTKLRTALADRSAKHGYKSAKKRAGGSLTQRHTRKKNSYRNKQQIRTLLYSEFWFRFCQIPPQKTPLSAPPSPCAPTHLLVPARSPRYPPTCSLPLSPVPLFHHENPFALPIERRTPYNSHPPLGRTRRSSRYAPALHLRHREIVHHPHKQRIHSRQHFQRKRPPGSLAPHLPPPTHRPRLPTPAPIATRPRRQKRNTAFGSALRPFSTCRSDKTLAVSRLRSVFGHRRRKVGGEALRLATFSQTSFPTFVSGSKRGDATQRKDALTRAIARLGACIILAKSLSLPQDCQ